MRVNAARVPTRADPRGGPPLFEEEKDDFFYWELIDN